jgi:hypothetical protein
MPGVRKLPAELAPAPVEPKRARTTRAKGTETTETPDAPVESAVDAPAAPAGPWGQGDAGDAPEGSVDAVLAGMQSARPVSAPPATTTRRRSNGGGPEPIKGDRSTQWGKGELSNKISEWLRLHPLVNFSATEMTRELNAARAQNGPIAQTGSVAYTLDRLVTAGTALLAQDAPRRYQAAPEK